MERLEGFALQIFAVSVVGRRGGEHVAKSESTTSLMAADVSRKKDERRRRIFGGLKSGALLTHRPKICYERGRGACHAGDLGRRKRELM